MRGIIRVEFEVETGKVMLNAPLANQAEKDTTIKVLCAAINIAVAYQEPSAIIRPNAPTAPKLPGNGKPIPDFNIH